MVTTAILELITLRYSGPCIAGWSSLVARRAHNPKVASSNLAPATKIEDPGSAWVFVLSGTNSAAQSAEIGSRRPHGYYVTSVTSLMECNQRTLRSEEHTSELQSLRHL